MSLDLTRLMESALRTVFGLGTGLIKPATYTRPASFASATGLTVAAEGRAAVQALVASYRPLELGTVAIQPGDEKVLVRATELTAIAAPAPGDYLVETATGLRREILSARLDPSGQLWVFQTVRSLHEDWGDLSAASVSADWGDLSAATESEDWMGLL